MNEPGSTSWQEHPFDHGGVTAAHEKTKTVRKYEAGEAIPERAVFLGMHIEMRNDSLRTTPTPVFFYEVTE